MKTKSQVYEHGEAAHPDQVTVVETAPHSVDLSCNAKGQYSWTIKIYFKEEDKGSIVDEVEKINKLMLERFPNVDDVAKIAELDKKAKK
jgi:hypothetical protein